MYVIETVKTGIILMLIWEFTYTREKERIILFWYRFLYWFVLKWKQIALLALNAVEE